MDIINLGLVEYDKVLAQQTELQAKRAAGEIEDTLIICEHPSVITKGRQNADEDFFHEPVFYEDHKVQVAEVGRGGKLTYHGPGQLVVYLIINIKKRKLSVPQFIAWVEQSIIDCLAEFGLAAELVDGLPGVFIGSKKIASLGFAISKGVTMHGIAINVNNDLTPFTWFNPCGMGSDYSVTSMQQELGKKIDMNDLATKLINCLN